MDKEGNKIVQPVTAVDLILDMLTTLDEEYLSLSSLSKAGAVFDMQERNIRVALTRLTSQEKVEKVKRGHYKAALVNNYLQHSVKTWLDREKDLVNWNHCWIGVCDTSNSRSNRKELRAHERALSIKGFRRTKSGLYLRPDNLKGGLDRIVEALSSLGLAQNASVFGISRLTDNQEKEARLLWDKENLPRRYKSIIQDLDTSENKLKTLSQIEKAKETLIVGRTAISKVVRDPLLPIEICDDKARQLLTKKLSNYQFKAKKIWGDLIL